MPCTSAAPPIWGNPFAVTRSSEFHGLPGSWFVRGEDGSIHHPVDDTQTSARQKAVELYAAQVLEQPDSRVSVEMIRAELAGHDLVCWCPRDEPCHADFLVSIANSPARVPVAAGPIAAGGCPTCGVRRPTLANSAEGPPTGGGSGRRCPTCGTVLESGQH